MADFPSDFSSRLPLSGTFRICSIIHFWCDLLLYQLFVYSKICAKMPRLVVLTLVLHNRYFDTFISKWLDAAVILAIISPAFLTIQAIIPLQIDILDVCLFCAFSVGRCKTDDMEHYSSGFCSRIVLVCYHPWHHCELGNFTYTGPYNSQAFYHFKDIGLDHHDSLSHGIDHFPSCKQCYRFKRTCLLSIFHE